MDRFRVLTFSFAILLVASVSEAQQGQCVQAPTTVVHRLYFDLYPVGTYGQLGGGPDGDALLAAFPSGYEGNMQRVRDLKRWGLELNAGGTFLPTVVTLFDLTGATPKREGWLFRRRDQDITVAPDTDGRCAVYVPFTAMRARRVKITPEPADLKVKVTCPRQICGEHDTIELTTRNFPPGPGAVLMLHFGTACNYPLDLSAVRYQTLTIRSADLLDKCNRGFSDVLAVRSGLTVKVPRSISVEDVKSTDN